MAWHKNCRVREHNAVFLTLKPSGVSFLIARRGIERDLAPRSAPFLARSARPAESERTLGVRVCCEVRVTADALWAVGAMLPFAVVCSLSSLCASFRGTCSAFPPSGARHHLETCRGGCRERMRRECAGRCALLVFCGPRGFGTLPWSPCLRLVVSCRRPRTSGTG